MTLADRMHRILDDLTAITQHPNKDEAVAALTMIVQTMDDIRAIMLAVDTFFGGDNDPHVSH